MKLQRILDWFGVKAYRPGAMSKKTTKEEYKLMCLYPGIQCWLGHFCAQEGLPLKTIDRTEFSILVDTGKRSYEIPREKIFEMWDTWDGGGSVRLMDYIMAQHRAAC